jgi:hypothetical protein
MVDMSRGPGLLQQYLTEVLGRSYGKALTFAEIMKIAIPDIPDGHYVAPHFVRSMRPALAGLCVGGELGGPIARVGRGRPGDPYRYHVNPVLFLLVGNKEGYEAACKALETKDAA